MPCPILEDADSDDFTEDVISVADINRVQDGFGSYLPYGSIMFIGRLRSLVRIWNQYPCQRELIMGQLRILHNRLWDNVLNKDSDR